MTARMAASSQARRSVTCAFCQGRGLDPFGLLSPLAACQVCLGRGRVSVRTPFRACAYCQGSGVQPHRRLTCGACEGRGVQTVPEPPDPCPACGGLGADPAKELELPCPTCTGRGVVSRNATGRHGKWRGGRTGAPQV